MFSVVTQLKALISHKLPPPLLLFAKSSSLTRLFLTRLEKTCWRIFNHGEITFLYVLYIQGSNLETEKAIAKLSFCAPEAISVWIFRAVLLLKGPSFSLLAEATRCGVKMSWYLGEFIMASSIFTIESQDQQQNSPKASMTHHHLTAGIRSFSHALPFYH